MVCRDCLVHGGIAMNHRDPTISLDSLIRDQLIPMVATMSGRLDSIDQRLDALEQRQTAVEERLKAVEDRLWKVEFRLDETTATKEDIARLPTTPMMFGTVIAIVGLVVGGIALAPYLRP